MDKRDKTSFGEVTADVPSEFIDKYCTCYLKQCLSNIGFVRGIITGFRSIKGQDVVYFQAEDGHDFFVPLTNVAYYELVSEEALQKGKEQREEEAKKTHKQEEENITGEIEVQMQKVQEQLKNANKSESSGNPSAEEEGDSEFVFKL